MKQIREEAPISEQLFLNIINFSPFVTAVTDIFCAEFYIYLLLSVKKVSGLWDCDSKERDCIKMKLLKKCQFKRLYFGMRFENKTCLLSEAIIIILRNQF